MYEKILIDLKITQFTCLNTLISSKSFICSFHDSRINKFNFSITHKLRLYSHWLLHDLLESKAVPWPQSKAVNYICQFYVTIKQFNWEIIIHHSKQLAFNCLTVYVTLSITAYSFSVSKLWIHRCTFCTI